jgi:hypothetical protein
MSVCETAGFVEKRRCRPLSAASLLQALWLQLWHGRLAADSRRAPKDDNEAEVELLDVEKMVCVGDEAVISTIAWFLVDCQHAAGVI